MRHNKQELYTSNILEGCVCFSARQYAYKFSYLTYSTLTTCAGDRNGFNEDTKSYSGYPYLFFGCSNITMNSCGCESSYNTINLDCCKSFVINAMSDWSAKDKAQQGYNIEKQINLKNCQNITFNNCTIGTRIPGKRHIELDRSTGIQMNNCTPRKTGGSTDNVQTNMQDCQKDTQSSIQM